MSAPSLTPSSRSDLLDELESRRFDVVVIGAGITGAGVARDAAARGLTVAVIDGNDFAAGTSSRSSKLIHGGLRYLASGEVDLVRKTARERQAVHAMAPHLAEPCFMVVPARNLGAATKFRTGIGTYEKLGGIGDADRHEMWDSDAISDNEPLLRTDPYNRAVAYREYLTDDARLVLGVLRAASASGAVIASRLSAEGVLIDGGQVSGVIARCSSDGPTAGRRVEITGSVVVNAAGPWVEDVARLELGELAPGTEPSTRVHLSRGIHLVVDRERLPINHLVICAAEDKRSIFVIPRGDVVYIGTTDTSYHGSQALWPEIEADDVRYLLAPIDRYFDIEPLAPDDVIAAWAGVRPLVAEPGKSAKEISRKDEVTVGPGGMVSITGGKLTGFRRMATDIVDVIGKQLGRPLADGPGPTPIPGGDRADAGIHPRLVRLYGSEASAVLAMGADELIPGVPVVAGEVTWAIDVEAATTLEDVVYRRTRVAWFVAQHREQLADEIADRMADHLGWTAERRHLELTSVRARFGDELAFKRASGGDHR